MNTLSKVLTAMLITSFSLANTFAETAIFAGGCFWCMEKPFDAIDGVTATTSGYAGGSLQNPTYEQVSSGKTNHREVVEVQYDPKKVSYDRLLETFWVNVDPFDDSGQFCDQGHQYTPAIYYTSAAQKQAAEASLAQQEARFNRPIAVAIVKLPAFYPAEGYHQDYYKKKPLKYEFYRLACGRDSRLNEVWGAQ
ncbi:MAG: peptide-methionine (S)-S-oxide reductase MsrA [Pseudomonadota bacterium]|nr:peptide-methionine (S)-S-oxide reductase MsrA [Pseudomonadota bacterium]